MEPDRENCLVDLLDRLLNKGAILHADLIISVAGVPLIGVNLKAALASIETMLDYGMMEAWDKSTRQWYANEISNTPVPLIENEYVISKTFGSIWHSKGIIDTWRPGFCYITNKRLFMWRDEEMLLETSLDEIGGLMIRTEPHMGKEREELALYLKCGEVGRLRISDVGRFKDAIEDACVKKLEIDAKKECVVISA